MRTGKTMVSASALCVFATALVGGISAAGTEPGFSVPPGFSASLYVQNIPEPRDIAVMPDGTLTLHSRGDTYEILPPANGEPMTVLRVDAQLATVTSPPKPGGSPQVARLSWSPDAGELISDSAKSPSSAIPVAPGTLALARTLGRHHEVTLAPDGTLFVADWRRDAVWHVRLAPHTRT